eukprot:749933-Hanusia_phi.AAC.2
MSASHLQARRLSTSTQDRHACTPPQLLLDQQPPVLPPCDLRIQPIGRDILQGFCQHVVAYNPEGLGLISSSRWHPPLPTPQMHRNAGFEDKLCIRLLRHGQTTPQAPSGEPGTRRQGRSCPFPPPGPSTRTRSV